MPTSKWGVKERLFSFTVGGKGEGGFFDIHNVASAQIIFFAPDKHCEKIFAGLELVLSHS